MLRLPGLWLLSMLTIGVSPPMLADTTHPCARVASDRDRLSCYDAAFGRPSMDAAAPAAAATTPAAAGVPVAAAATAPAMVGLTTEQEFGLNEAEKRERTPVEARRPEELPSIESTATIVSTRRTGEFVYTLANGQVWTQTEAQQSGYVREGSPVTIKRAALGSYKLNSGKVSTRVRRVQ